MNDFFSAQDYLKRIEKAQKVMSSNGMGCWVITDTENVQYFTGVRPRTRNRPQLFVVPADGEPVILVEAVGERGTKKQSPVEVRSYSLPFTVEYLKDLLVSKNLSSKVLGFEGDVYDGSFLLMALKEKMEDTDFINISPFLRSIRWKKTPREIELLKQNIQLQTDVFKIFAGEAKTGQTERQLAQVFQRILLERGIQNSFFQLNAGSEFSMSNNYTDLKWEENQPLWVDATSEKNGYWCDFATTYIKGNGHQTFNSKWVFLENLVSKIVAEVKPGITLAELHVKACEISSNLGYDPKNVDGLLGSRKHFGHGVGISRNEFPEIGPWENSVLEEGMVLTIEPAIMDQGRITHLEEMILVSSTGCETLTGGWDNLIKVN